MFRFAQADDLARILEIYNQVIERRTVTADLEPATTESRQTWFHQHLNHKKYPIWVYELDGKIVAWCSYSQFYSRAAYDGSSEISFYLDKAVHGKGIGKACVSSLNKCQMGFEIWGKLPQVADMETHFEDLVILGLKHKYE